MLGMVRILEGWADPWGRVRERSLGVGRGRNSTIVKWDR